MFQVWIRRCRFHAARRLRSRFGETSALQTKDREAKDGDSHRPNCSTWIANRLLRADSMASARQRRSPVQHERQ